MSSTPARLQLKMEEDLAGCSVAALQNSNPLIKAMGRPGAL
jgi:hypothetical protein